MLPYRVTRPMTMRVTTFRLRRHAAKIGFALSLLTQPLSYGQMPEAEFDALMTALAGDDLTALHAAKVDLHDHVSAATAPGKAAERKALEAQLVAALEQPGQPIEAQLWLLRQIEAIGSDAAIPALTALIAGADDRVADSARMALQSIPTEKAAAALLDGLKQAPSPARKIGFVQSLGARGYEPALPDLIALHADANLELALAAVDATAKIGGAKAETALAALRYGSEGRLQSQAETGALIATQDQAVLASMAARSPNRAARSGAFAKAIDESPSRGRKLLQEILADDSIAHREDLLRIAVRSDQASLRRDALKALPTLPPAEQAAIIGALPDGRSTAHESAVLPLADSANEQLQLQAIEALGRIGTVKSLPRLLSAIGSRNRDLREAAAAALARVPDARIDKQLRKAVQTGTDEERILAVKGLSSRNSPGAAALLNEIAANADNALELRREAVDAMEGAGDASSFKALVGLVVSENQSRLRRDALVGIKRMSRRAADPASAWEAFDWGFAATAADPEARIALISIIDSASTPEAIDFLKTTWAAGDEATRDAILRALPAWRNWDAGHFMADLLESGDANPELRKSVFDGISRLILGSDQTYARDEKFALAERALALAADDSERQPILASFRYATWQDRNYVFENEVVPELKQAVLDADGR